MPAPAPYRPVSSAQDVNKLKRKRPVVYGHGDSADCCDDRSGASSFLSHILIPQNAGGLVIVTVPMPSMIPRRTRQMASALISMLSATPKATVVTKPPSDSLVYGRQERQPVRAEDQYVLRTQVHRWENAFTGLICVDVSTSSSTD
ncbi:hypothetical protein PILCRDRAFT_2117 [Piloderma croceum F 1598]|uniref:Uncharacterized protein n=1 Tax=Piloderma croceum (strain F 1598) TaxID=765440 RepID=A0A0C3CJE0_PILCF|nr:hypothetical protein PILCRDRAFT_2117 [Piloderma croceum F 1598]